METWNNRAKNGRRYSTEEKVAAIRMVRTLRVDLGTIQGTVQRVADQLGCGVHSVLAWVCKSDADDLVGAGSSSDERLRVRQFEYENRELKRANEIFKRAAYFFVWSSSANTGESGTPPAVRPAPQDAQKLPNHQRRDSVTRPDRIGGSRLRSPDGELKTFTSIVLPIVKPGIGALAIFTFISSWNDYFSQLVFTNSEMMKTLPLGLASMAQSAEFTTNYGLLMAGALLASLPMIVVFLSFQSYFTQGVTMGAVKG